MEVKLLFLKSQVINSDVAKAIAPEANIRYTGIRPGENT